MDNRTLRGVLDMAPFKWEGTNPSLPRQCGPRLAVFFTRIQPFNPEELSALTNYIATIPRPPNRYRPLGGELTEQQAQQLCDAINSLGDYEHVHVRAERGHLNIYPDDYEQRVQCLRQFFYDEV